ncbi:hypothetical protein [Cupriavidus basilensis]
MTERVFVDGAPFYVARWQRSEKLAQLFGLPVGNDQLTPDRRHALEIFSAVLGAQFHHVLPIESSADVGIIVDRCRDPAWLFRQG